MSYILDALRKADAERERGAVPGLNAQAMPPVSDDAELPRRTNPLPWAVAALSVVLLAALAWFTLGRPTPPAPPAAMPPVAAVQPGRATLPARVPDEPRAPAPPTTSPAAAPPPRVAVAAPRKPASEVLAGPGADKPDATARTGAGATTTPVVPLRELPEDVRRQIPPLAIGGSMFSKDAASRMLIVNGQVLHEGDDVAPGLKLEQIRLKAAVLRFQQHRFEITY